MKNSYGRLQWEDRVINAMINVFAVSSLLICAYPLYFIVIASVSDPDLVNSGRVLFWPKGFNVDAYRFIMMNTRLWQGYANTIFYTLATTLVCLAVTIPGGYALSRKDFVGRKFILQMLTFTMFFSGGLIPTYILVSNLHLTNTRTILILLHCTSVFDILIVRTFFSENIPKELFEAASMDGCGNTRFFCSIVLPLSSTIIAVIALYAAVGQWNSFFSALIYITKSDYQPLQVILRSILIQGQSLGATMEDLDPLSAELLHRQAQLVKYGVIVVSTLPIISAYPFLQKYFVKGMMIGSIKG